MICTCTMNPSLDYYMEFEEPIAHQKVNRSSMEYFEAGGKGINISIVLSNLQIPTRAAGFLGGFVRDYFIESLQKYSYIEPNFTYIEGQTRINVKLNDADGESDLNAGGPYITSEEMAKLSEKVSRLDEGDYFVLAGQSQDYLKEPVGVMLQKAISSGVRVCLDTNADIMEASLPYHPFLIKTTAEELERMKSGEVDEAKAAEIAHEIFEKGAQNVIILFRSNQHAILVCEKGTFICHLTDSDEKIISTVGTGDSLVAGFLMNYLRSRDPLDSFRFGCSAGSATAYSRGLATREKIDSLYEKTKIAEIHL